MSKAIEEVKKKLSNFIKAIDATTLTDEESDALDHVLIFWSNPDVIQFEKLLDVDRFYQIKEYHIVLNGKYRNNESDIEIKWGEYVGEAMSHRVSLRKKKMTKRY
jgi:hypothetical protein